MEALPPEATVRLKWPKLARRLGGTEAVRLLLEFT